jgi:hypothetical protein
MRRSVLIGGRLGDMTDGHDLIYRRSPQEAAARRKRIYGSARGSAAAEIPPLEGKNATKCSEGSCRKRPISVETVRRYVAQNRLTEREGALLRGSAAMRGFAGCVDHSLDWLERFSPGVGARFRGATLNTGGETLRRCGRGRDAGV